MKEKQRAETEKRSSARLGYFLVGLTILLAASACGAQTRQAQTKQEQTRQELATLKGPPIASIQSPSLPTARRSHRAVGTIPSSCGWEMRGNEVGGREDVGLFEQLKMCRPSLIGP